MEKGRSLEMRNNTTKMILIAILTLSILCSCNNTQSINVVNPNGNSPGTNAEVSGPVAKLFNGETIQLKLNETNSSTRQYISEQVYRFETVKDTTCFDKINIYDNNNGHIEYDSINKKINIQDSIEVDYKFKANKNVEYNIYFENKEAFENVVTAIVKTQDKDISIDELEIYGIEIRPYKGLQINEYKFESLSILDFANEFGNPYTADVSFSSINKIYNYTYEYISDSYSLIIKSTDGGNIDSIIVSYK